MKICYLPNVSLPNTGDRSRGMYGDDDDEDSRGTHDGLRGGAVCANLASDMVRPKRGRAAALNTQTNKQRSGVAAHRNDVILRPRTKLAQPHSSVAFLGISMVEPPASAFGSQADIRI